VLIASEARPEAHDMTLFITADDLLDLRRQRVERERLHEEPLPVGLAVGDVRSDSTKRVASAVGEGSIAIATPGAGRIVAA